MYALWTPGTAHARGQVLFILFIHDSVMCHETVTTALPVVLCVTDAIVSASAIVLGSDCVSVLYVLCSTVEHAVCYFVD